MYSLTPTTAQRQREALSKYKAAIANPPVTTLVLPATAFFAVRSRAGNGALAAALSVDGPSGTRSIGSPALATNEFHIIGRLERGVSVDVNVAVDLYIDAGLGRYKRVLKGAI